MEQLEEFQIPLIKRARFAPSSFFVGPDWIFCEFVEAGNVAAPRLELSAVTPVEIVELLYRRHPQVRMELELVIEPLRAGLLEAYADKIWTRRHAEALA